MMHVWSMIDAYFNEHKPKSRFRIIKPSMYKSGPGGYPKLKGKASEVKNLTPALLSVWKRGWNENDQLHVAVTTALETSLRLDQMLEENTGFVLPTEVADEFFATALQHIQAQIFLKNYAGLQLFNITMKCHYFIHCAFRAKHMNPRKSWCFMGEDYMHHTKVLAGTCLKGNTMEEANRKMFDKLRCGMHLNFAGHSSQ